MTVAEQARALWTTYESIGVRPSMMMVAAALRAGHVSFRNEALRKALRPLMVASPHPKARHVAGQPGADNGLTQQAQTADSGHTSGQPSRAPADHNGILSGSQEGSNPPSLLPSVVETPPVPTNAVPAPSQPPGKPRGERAAIASQDANTDFGDFEPDVVELLAVEAALRKDGKISDRIVAEQRRRLAYWLRTHGVNAFAAGLRVGIESGKGVAYGGGAMRRYDPERDAVGVGDRRSRNDDPFGPENLPSDKTGIRLADIPPWKRPPFDPAFQAWRAANPTMPIPA